MSDRNKALVRDWLEGISTKDEARMMRPWAKGFVVHAGAGLADLRGPAELAKVIHGFWAAMPDLTITIDDLVAEGDRIVGRTTARGTHRGAVFGVPPSGRKVEFMGFGLYRCSDAGIEEEWILDDLLTFLTQIGAVNSPIGRSHA